MGEFYDELETRSEDAREAAIAAALPGLIANAMKASGIAAHLDGVEAAQITDRAALAKFPVLRKSDLGVAQKSAPPFGGLKT